MEIKIGIKQVSRELALEVEQEEHELIDSINAARAEGRAIEITDKRGSRYLIAADAFAYLEIAPVKPARVGFSL